MYKHWDKTFYPKGEDKLPYYAHYFDTLELNTTFYHLPQEQSVKNWQLKTDKNFLFSIKASQYITHRKRLIDCKEALKVFYKRIHYLKNKQGPILFQLPPSFKLNSERLQSFLKLLKKGNKAVFEFRHPSWYVEETYDLLRTHQVALCVTDITGEISPLEITAPFTYLRLHGPKKYSSSYQTKDLEHWKWLFLEWNKKKVDVYCYFDNDDKANAVKDGLRLKKMLFS